RRRCYHGNRLRVARAGDARLRRDPSEGLSRGAGGRRAGRRGLHRHQHVARSPVRIPRPAAQAVRRMNGRRAIGPGGLILAALVLLATVAPLVAPHDVAGLALLRRLAPPAWNAGGSWTHPFGTDPLGRDVLSRVIYGARTSFAIAGAAML